MADCDSGDVSVRHQVALDLTIIGNEALVAPDILLR